MKIALVVTTPLGLIIFLTVSCATKRVRVGAEPATGEEGRAKEMREGKKPAEGRLSPAETERRETERRMEARRLF